MEPYCERCNGYHGFGAYGDTACCKRAAVNAATADLRQELAEAHAMTERIAQDHANALHRASVAEAERDAALIALGRAYVAALKAAR